MTNLKLIISAALDEASPHSIDIDPLADAVEKALLDAAGGPDHIVLTKGVAWTIQHPIHERFEDGDLFRCPFTNLVVVAAGDDLFEEDGRYRVWLDRNELQWQRDDG